MSFLDQFSNKVNQGLNLVTSQTKDFTDQVKIDNEIRNLEKKVQTNYENLGRLFYEYSRKSGGEAPDYEQTMTQIDEALKEIEEKKASKEEIKSKIVCASCGKSIPADMKFCSYCGASTTPVLMQAPNAAVPDGAKCPGCGAVLAPGAKFCTSCGISVEEKAVETSSVNELLCPSCGAVITPGMSFCISCGIKLNTEQQFAGEGTIDAEQKDQSAAPADTISDVETQSGEVQKGDSETKKDANASDECEELERSPVDNKTEGNEVTDEGEGYDTGIVIEEGKASCETVQERPLFCTSCGAKLDAEALFCTSCGAKVE